MRKGRMKILGNGAAATFRVFSFADFSTFGDRAVVFSFSWIKLKKILTT